MGKYLELFRGEVGDLTEKTKLENKPYVAYSTKLGKVTYTVVPAKEPVIEGPADNEFWYTTSDGSYITFTEPYYVDDQGNVVNLTGAVSQETYNGKNIAKFSSNNIYPIRIGSMLPGEWLYGIERQKLTSIHVPSTIYLGTDFLNGFSNIESIILDGPCGIFMGDYTGQSHFENTKISEFTIPEGSTLIPYACFANCTHLNTINYNGTTSEWESIEKYDDWNQGCPEITVHCTDGDIVIPVA